MSDPVNDAEVALLVERIAAALRWQQPAETCQGLVVALASRAGWGQARRLLLARVHRA
ncbi:hypothetical protein A8924_6347 [Saccharopolyspora erythraea NRRL 2338]|uniref:Uncharacterized protein n=1 Tax=Saccharopolyspora erythraea TaxID=1836 RepID=A0ABP3LUF6_SACER|nr:hypothetical protein [Saccharopolyspora erythraea]PFG98821.1 hypothetical protein A8924_6347 [Saccharopolyspora erythraea NRRL 2338]QRK88818.1 hypothetical protein JQX30_30070 [Saccharopolyspora erythraea]